MKICGTCRTREVLLDNRKTCTKCLEYNRKYSIRYRGYVKANLKPNFKFNSYRHEARRKSYAFSINFDLFTKIVSSECFYCGVSPLISYIGIDRVDNNSGYVEGNCVPCCSACNYSKRDRHVEEFLEHCRRVVEFQSNKVTNTNLTLRSKLQKE